MCRGLDLWLLRRVGAELHVLHRALAQCDWPLLRSGQLRPDLREQLGGGATSREWFRPNPPLPSIKWGPRNNTNIQQSALLIALNHVARNKDTYLENYWIKNKRAVERGKTGPTYGWIIPAGQRRKQDAADAVNELRRQGLEVHRATNAFKAGTVSVEAGDYVIRGDQPYRTLADMYFSVQNYAPANPSMRRHRMDVPVHAQRGDQGGQRQGRARRRRVLLTAEAKAPGGIEGTGPVVIVDHTTDNVLMAFRFKHAAVKMAAEEISRPAAASSAARSSFQPPTARCSNRR